MKNALLLIVVALVALGMWGCGQTEDPVHETEHAVESGAPKAVESDVVRFEPESLKIANLAIETVRTETGGPELAVNGGIEASTGGVVKVTSPAPGKVVRIAVTIGSLVRAGQMLATISSTELASAQAAYRQADARAKMAAQNLSRQRKLADLGEFGRHKVEEARSALAEAQRIEADAKSTVSESEAKADAAEADQSKAEADLDVARRAFARVERLLKDGLASQEEFERARAERIRAEAGLFAAQRAVQSARAVIRSAQSALSAAESRTRTARQVAEREEKVYLGGYLTSKEVVEAEATLKTAQLERSAAADSVRILSGVPGGGSTLPVTSPISGQVTELPVTLGESITPDRALFSVLNAGTMWAQLSVFQRDLSLISVGQPVSLSSEAVPGRTFAATVAYVGQQIDETTRTARVRCVLKNPGGALRPGMFVTGRIATGRGSRLSRIVVPAEAVQEIEGKRVVFMPGEAEGQFKPVEVGIGQEYDGKIEVLSGLTAGTRIVTKNAFTVKAQMAKGKLGDEH